MSWMDGNPFGSGGSRRGKNKTPEDLVLAADFKRAFRREYPNGRPLLQRTPGGRINLRDYAPLDVYDELEEDFAGLADVELEGRELDRILDSTGGVPVGWVDKAGAKWLAVIGVKGAVLRVPAGIFSNDNFGDPIAVLWTTMIAHGAYLSLPLEVADSKDSWDRISPSIQLANERNKPAVTNA